MNFLGFCNLISSQEKVVEFLRDKGVLRKTTNCDRCHRSMTNQVRTRAIDGIVYRCPNCKCEKSIRIGSFLSDCRLALDVFASLVYLLQTEMPFKFIAEILNLQPNTVTDYANLLREEYSKDLIERGRKLGGPGRIVQVDESLLSKESQKI
jgi:transposase-like protein